MQGYTGDLALLLSSIPESVESKDSEYDVSEGGRVAKRVAWG